MSKQHNYKLTVKWTGNTGKGTSSYTDYERSHVVTVNGKKTLYCSSDSPFRGDKTKHNPEDLLLAAISSCHMLWYLHLCVDAGVIVVDYTDKANGTMIQDSNGGGRFTEVTLNPTIVVTDKSMADKAIELHKKAHEKCFISNSVNFPVNCKPKVLVK